MAENTEILIKDGEKFIPYPPASLSCNSIGSVVPIGFAREQVFFNNGLKALFNIDEYVAKRLKYGSVQEMCKAFAKEQIDAIATAIYNWERNGNAMIISDQTGVGKGRIAAGLIRYSIMHLNKRPIFFTEKPNLFSDIFRDLFDIGLDAGVLIAEKPKGVESIVTFTEEELTEKVITKIIKKDIKDNESLRVDYTNDEDDFLDKLFTDKYEDELDEIIELYRAHLLQNGLDISDNLVKKTKAQIEDSIKEAKKEGRIQVVPYGVAAFDIINNQGNLVYSHTTAKAKECIKKGSLTDEYKVVLLTYSALQGNIYKEGVLTEKGVLIFNMAQNNVVILDEAHNAAGSSKRAEIIKDILRVSLYCTYISATWAKRPDNLPLYAVRTSIKDAFLSDSQIQNTFRNGGLALQEAVSSKLVANGELIRREIPNIGIYDYQYEEENSSVGQEQILLLNRVTLLWDSILDNSKKLNSAISAETLKKMPEREDKQTRKRWKYKGSIKAKTFQLFSFFLLSLKVKQCVKEALEQLRNGRKVVIAISSTLESAFDNVMRDYVSKVPYQVGDTIQNDLSQIFRYYAYICNRVGFELPPVVDNNGEIVTRVPKINLIDRDWERTFAGMDVISPTGVRVDVNEIFEAVRYDALERYNKLKNDIFPLGLPLSPIDVIKAYIANEGFTIDEITGRGRQLVFNKNGNDIDTSYGIISNRQKPPAKELVNKFNSNELDCLILNVSGATGLSLHALPTKDGSKIVEPVNVVPKTPPTSLLPKNEVKQRCMLIVQMELNVATEQQKLGRISRNGQVLPPIYKYIISAIPSEARLTAMMQKKLKSLMANTTGEQDFGKDTFNVDDLFSDVAVIPWNDTCEELGRGMWQVKNAKQIEENTKILYFASYSLQVAFFKKLQENLNKHIQDLIEKGQYFGKLAFREYNARTEAVIPFIIGENDATSDFANHAFLELAKCDVFDVKNSEYIVSQDIIKYLTFFSFNSGGAVTFKNVDEWRDAFQKQVQEFADNYIEDLQDSLADESNAIKQLEQEIEEYRQELGTFPDGDEIFRLDSLINELKKESQDLVQKLMQGSTDPSDALRIQEINAQLGKYNEDLNILTKGQDVSDVTRRIKYLQRQISNDNDAIEGSRKNINRLEERVIAENEVKDSLISFTKKIGKVFKYKTYAEYENTDDEGNVKYTYSELFDKEVVLTGVKYDFNNQTHLIKSAAELIFTGVTQKYNTELSKIYPTIPDDKINSGAQPKEFIEETNNEYNGYWDMFIKNIDTGYEKQLVFLSGNLLRGMAYNYLLQNSGEIIKYNTDDKKLKISLQLSEASATAIMSTFNAGNNYPLLFGLNQDNLNRIVPQMVANTYWYEVGTIAMETIFDTNLFFFCATIKSLQNKEMQGLKSQNAEREDFIKAARPYIADNLDEVIFTFCADEPDKIQALDAIISGIGSQYTNDVLDVFSTDMRHFLFEVGPDPSGLQYASPASQFITNPIKVFVKGTDAIPANHVEYLMSKKIKDTRLISNANSPWFSGNWNLSVSYSTLVALISYLRNMRIQFCAVTSADNINIAEPSFVFDMASSTRGLIDNTGIIDIDNIGGPQMDEVENAITSFIEYYKNL